jgi:hypothetical protein
LDRRSKVELYEQIRREYEFGVGTVQGVARKFGVHRRQVRQAINNAVPPERKQVIRSCPTLDPVKPFIEEVLVADKSAPRKQRHTAHRMWMRLCEEMPQHPVAQSTVRAYIRQRKWDLGLAGRETHVPQCYDWGVEAQVDWYEAYAILDGERTKVQIFCMRSMKSGGGFHRAYLHATQQAFFEAHELAFAYFGGVFQLLRYDNLASAVKKIFRGYTREEHTRFIAFRSHWEFNAEFCGAAQPQEKGGVEGEGGTFRRNHLVPVPQASNLAELNGKILAGCLADQSRLIGDRPTQVGPLILEERSHLLPLAREGFDLAVTSSPQVDGKGCVKTHLVWYSTPLQAGTKTQVRALPSSVEVWHGGVLAAVHERSYERGAEVYNLEHYLQVFDRKPGAFPGSRPLAQWRDRGLWPQSFDKLLALWQERIGKHAGTRAMVDLLLLVPVHGWPALRAAADNALALGCTDASAVKCLLTHTPAAAVPTLSPEELGALSRYDRPQPQLSGYDQLLGGAQ